jgi:hypothetical protein
MATGFGLNSWLAFGEESTYGTAVARTKWLEITEESIAAKQSIISKPALRQVSASNRVQSKKDVGGAFSFQAMFEGMEKIIKHAMGTVAAVSGAGPYTHAFSLASALPAGLTIEVVRDAAAIGGSSAFLYEGCQISKLTLKQGIEDFLMVEAEVIGEDFSLVAATATSFTTFNGIDWSMLTTSTLNGASIKLQAWEMTIENGLAADRFKLGQRIRLGLGRAQTRKISGKLTAEFEQVTEYNLFAAQTTLVPLVIGYDNGLGGASNKQFTFTLPKVAIQGDPPKVADQGPIKMEISFDAFQNAAQNDEMTATLIGSLNVSQ